VNKSKKAITIFITIAVIIKLLSIVTPSQAEESLSLRLSFDQPYYNSNQKFTAIITVNNAATKRVTSARVKLYIGQRLELDKNRSLPTKLPTKTSYTYSWSRTLKPGETQLKATKALSSLKLREGTYPAWATITVKNKTISKKLSALVIVDQKVVPPLSVALLWNLHDYAHFDGNNLFIDDNIQKDCIINSNHAGRYSIFLSSLVTHPNFKVNMNFTPLLAQQIVEISKGYKTKKDGKVVTIGKDSKDSSNAQKIISGYARLAKNGQIEMLPAPYSYPSLDYLAEQGWKEDIVNQIKKGKTVTKEIFELPEAPAGIYIPNLKLTNKTFNYLEKDQVKYMVLDGSYIENLQQEDKDIYRPYQVKDGQGDKTMVFFSDNFASSILTDNSDPEASAQLFLGILAETYLKQPDRQKVVVIAPDAKTFYPSAELLETLYTRFEQTPWLNSVTFSRASQIVPADTKPIDLTIEPDEESTINGDYGKELISTRNTYHQFKAMTTAAHPLEKELLDYLFIAESRDFLNQKNGGKENPGFVFLEKIRADIRTELDKIKMPDNQTITFTSSKGKIPIAIDNKSNYSYKITMTVQAENLAFPNGNSKTIELHPGENFFTLPVIAKTSNPQEITVTLHYGDYIIKQGSLSLKSMYYNITIIVIICLLLISVAFPLGWRYLKTVQNSSNKNINAD